MAARDGSCYAEGEQTVSESEPGKPVRPVREAKPPWLKVRAPGGENYRRLKQTLRELDLYTVCEEARCPNVGECWSEGTATVMLLGHTCTRGCRFCAVTTGNPRGAVDPREPEHVARALASLELNYVVLTMVDRDDLLDGGAAHMARAVVALHERRPSLLIETLVGDFGGHHEDVNVMLSAGPDVFAHNIEVVRRITPTIRDRRCSYDRSLDVLAYAKMHARECLVKSSIMVGIGETDDEVSETLCDLHAAGVDVVTLGQYLRPTPRHAPVARYVTPEQFDRYANEARAIGFAYVASGPLVRSSYHAAEAFIRARLRPGSADRTQPRAAPRAAPSEPRDASTAAYGPAPALLSPASLVRRTHPSRPTS
jgi:lipoic acid synthetase